MTNGDIEVFVTSSKRVKIHVGSMGFAMWDHTGSGELYNDEIGPDALILGQVGKEVQGTEQVGILITSSGTIESSICIELTEYIYALCASR